MLDTTAKIKNLAHDISLLIVEDDKDIMNSLKRFLQHFFTTIYTASNATDALQIYKQYSQQSSFLVVTDINLGFQSGIDLACQLKELNEKQRIIAVSGSQSSDLFIKAIECGIDRFLLKPFNQTKLFEALNSVLEKIYYDQELESSKEYTLQLLNEQDQFLKNAIHEIHTPLSIIITNIDLLRMQYGDNESLRAIEAGGRTIQNSYEDMTYLMKHSHQKYAEESIDLIDFIQERMEYFQCIAEANALKILLFAGQPNIRKLYFSKLKLSRLVDNTLSNAIKYAYKPSEIHITVGLNGERVFFEVRNQGPLIEDTQKVFERFYRESNTQVGYGLGLSIVAQICQEENVEVKLSSSEMQGTAFRYIFTL